MRDGKFEYVSKNLGKTIIERTKEIQIETNETLGTKFIYDVTWINDCEYHLTNKKMLKGDQKYNPAFNDTFRITILKIKNSEMTVRIISDSFDSRTEEFVIKKIE